MPAPGSSTKCSAKPSFIPRWCGSDLSPNASPAGSACTQSSTKCSAKPSFISRWCGSELSPNAPSAGSACTQSSTKCSAKPSFIPRWCGLELSPNVSSIRNRTFVCQSSVFCLFGSLRLYHQLPWCDWVRGCEKFLNFSIIYDIMILIKL